MMPRIASVHLAKWSIDLLRRAKVETSKRRNVETAASLRTIAASLRDAGRDAADSPLLLIEETRGQQIVARCCGVSSDAGVEPGMTLAHARALLPDSNIRVEKHRPERDLARLRALGAWAMRYSPIVAVDPPEDLLIDITGCERLFGGEERLIRRIARDLRALGFRANIAIASTIGCTWAVARFGGSPTSIILPGEERGAIAPLPVRGLRIDDETIDALREVDLEWIGQALEIPRAQLARRFGMAIITRIDQALGHADECIQPLRYRPPILVTRDFDGPTTQSEAIRIAMRDLLDELCEMLRQRERGVREMTMTLLRIDAPLVEVGFKLSHPSRSAKHLWSLILPKLESAQLGFGVDGISLHAIRTSRINHEQVEAVESRSSHHDDAALGELIDALVSRCGSERVLRFDAFESHVPEHAYIARPATAKPRLAATRQRSAARETRPSINRPSILFPRPERITVTTDESGAPARIHPTNEDRAILTAIGPERISPQWWQSAGRPAAMRDYYRAQDESGQWLWMYRECNSPHWFVHGLFG